MVEESIVKPQKRPSKVLKTLRKVKETPSKVKRWFVLGFYSKLNKFLRKYGIIAEQDTDIKEFVFENYKKPFVRWIVSIILTSIPIYLVLILTYIIPPIRAIPASVGIAILWWLSVEFKRDMVKK